MQILNKILKTLGGLYILSKFTSRVKEQSVKTKIITPNTGAQAELGSLVFLRVQFGSLIKKVEKIREEADKETGLKRELDKKGIRISELLNVLQKSIEKMDRAGELYDEAFRTTEAYNEFKKNWSELSDLLDYFVDYENELDSLDRFLPSELSWPLFKKSIDVIRELFKKGGAIRLEEALMRLVWDEDIIKNLYDFIIQLGEEKIEKLRAGTLVSEFADELADILYEEVGAMREDVKRIIDRKLHGKKLKEFLEKIEKSVGKGI